MPDALSLDEEFSKTADTVLAASDAIVAHCSAGNEDAVRSDIQPFLAILARIPHPPDDDGLLAARHTLDLADTLRITTTRGLPGILLISSLLDADDTKPFLSAPLREEIDDAMFKYRRFDMARLAEIALEKGQYQTSRDHIEALRNDASPEEIIMLDQMMKQIANGEMNQKRLALWTTGGVLFILFLLSIFNLVSGSGSKPVAQPRPILLDNLVKPLAGLDNPLFTENELRYCKAFYAVLYRASGKVDQNNQALVQRYKDNIDDYAKRCTKYRYKPEDMAKVEADMSRLDVDAEAAKLISAWNLDISLDAANKNRLKELNNMKEAMPQ